jgi:type I restriction enzyme R subunit
MNPLTESTVESAALAWLSELGWQVKHGSEIAPDGLFAERQDFGQVVLEQRLRDALLSKLIRGEIRVKDVERFLKERGL